MSKELYTKFLNVIDTFEEDFEEYDSINDAFMHEGVELEPGKYTGEAGLKLIELLKEADLKIECVESFGGEGMGDTFYSVYSVSNGTDKVFVKFDGWYASYQGAEFNERLQVYPREVTTTEYFDKPQ